MSHITTHVLDNALGQPAAGIPVALEAEDGSVLAKAVTDGDGRVGSLGPDELDPGVYRLRFATGAYHEARSSGASFYPEVAICFRVASTSEHYHVPLLLSPFGYSTYRGS